MCCTVHYKVYTGVQSWCLCAQNQQISVYCHAMNRTHSILRKKAIFYSLNIDIIHPVCEMLELEALKSNHVYFILIFQVQNASKRSTFILSINGGYSS